MKSNMPSFLENPWQLSLTMKYLHAIVNSTFKFRQGKQKHRGLYRLTLFLLMVNTQKKKKKTVQKSM